MEQIDVVRRLVEKYPLYLSLVVTSEGMTTSLAFLEPMFLLISLIPRIHSHPGSQVARRFVNVVKKTLWFKLGGGHTGADCATMTE